MADVDVLFQIGFAADTQGAADAKRASEDVASSAESSADRINASSRSVADGSAAAARGYTEGVEGVGRAAEGVAERVSAAGDAVTTGFDAEPLGVLREAFAGAGAAAEEAARAAIAGAEATAAAVEQERQAIAAAADAARAQAEETQRALDMIGDRLAGSAALRKEIAASTLSTKDQAKAVDGLKAQAAQAEEALFKLFTAGRLSAQDFERELGKVRTEMQALAQQGGDAGGGGGMLSELASGLGLDKLLASLNPVTLGVAGLTAGLAALAAAAAIGLKEFMESEVAVNRLRTALELAGQASAENVAKFKGLATSLQATSRFTDDAIMSAEAFALQMGVATYDLDKFTKAAVELASAMPQRFTLETAMQQLGMTLSGSAGRLGRIVRELDGLTEAELRSGKAADIMLEKFSGASARDLGTFSGAMEQLKNVSGDAAGEIFAMVAPMGQATATVRGATEVVGQAADALRGLVGLTDGLSGLGDALRAAFDSTIIGRFVTTLEALEKQFAVIDRLRMAYAALASMGMSERLAEDAQAAQAVAGTNPLGAFTPTEDQIDSYGRLAKFTKEYVSGIQEGVSSRLDAIAEAKEREAEALREALDGIAKRNAAIEDTNEGIREGTMGLDLQRTALDALAQSAQADLGALTSLAQAGKITWDDWASRVDDVKARLDALTQAAQAAAAEMAGILDPSGEGSSLTQGMVEEGGFLELPARDPDVMAGERRRFMGEAGQEGGLARDEQMETLDALIEQTGSYAMAVEMLNDQLERQGEALLINTDAYAKEGQQKAHAARMEERMNGLRAIGTRGIQTMANALIEGAISGELSLKKMLKATLESISQEAQARAAFELASGFAKLAVGDGHAAAEHFTSAAIFGGLAVAAGIGAKAIGGGEEGGGGGGRDRGTSSDLSTDESTSSSQDQLVGTSGRTINVTVTGSVMGTTPEQFAREIHSYLAEVDDEQGGRSSARG